MAECPVCKTEVSPGDIVWDDDSVPPRAYCSREHVQLVKEKLEANRAVQAKQRDKIFETTPAILPPPSEESGDEEETGAWQCPMCKKSAKTKQGLATHIRMAHKTPAVAGSVPKA